ncbi:MAG: polysaccharide deacetylase family protein [Oscillospiraceae bacterium]|nr:polysaccharide deacetylase family protein [Oscillospiraceae bacterium]
MLFDFHKIPVKAFVFIVVLLRAGMINTPVSQTNAIPEQSCEWGLHFEQDNTLPIPNMSDEILNPLGAYFHGNTDEKVIYITFDAGYENGHTAAILDALKKHNAPAAFFLVGPYIEDNPLLVERMVAEGHTVGNHSYDHPDMTGKSKEEFLRQLNKTAQAFKSVIGTDMPKFYRPPEGKFSTENLKWAQDAGYTTVLWSSAYVDWNNNSQPSHDYAFEKIDRRTFDGAVFLLHSTSKTNAEILDTQLSEWRQAGYRFGDIKELAQSNEGTVAHG